MTDSMISALAKVWAYQDQRPAIIVSGTTSLNRLIPIALGQTGQSEVVGRFLLGLYNGDDFPFALTDLRALDIEVFQDCMHVLAMDYSPEVEVHERVVDGGPIWQRLMELWAPEVVDQ